MRFDRGEDSMSNQQLPWDNDSRRLFAVVFLHFPSGTRLKNNSCFICAVMDQ